MEGSWSSNGGLPSPRVVLRRPGAAVSRQASNQASKLLGGEGGRGGNKAETVEVNKGMRMRPTVQSIAACLPTIL